MAHCDLTQGSHGHSYGPLRAGISSTSKHPFDGFKRGTKFENFYQNVKSYNLLMHHVRQSVVYMNNPNRQHNRVNDIEWFLDRIREDLSSIAFYGDGESLQPEVKT